MYKLFLIFVVTFGLLLADDKTDEFESEFETKTEQTSDPFLRYNRAMTDFNDFVYMNIFFPIGDGYAYIIPGDGRSAIKRVFHNIKFPIRFVNNILQLKVTNTFDESGRFLINSTIGLLGLFDIAKDSFGLKAHNEDFGQTLGYYGVGGGAHIVLPFLGPSNIRDAVSIFPDSYLNPISYYEDRGFNVVDNTEQSLGLRGFELINDISSRKEQYLMIKKSSVDFYILLREAYEQNRQKEIER